SEAFALSPGASARSARAHWGKPRGFRAVAGSESHDNPIMGTGSTSAFSDRKAIPRRDRNGAGPLPGTTSRRRGRWGTVTPDATIWQARQNRSRLRCRLSSERGSPTLSMKSADLRFELTEFPAENGTPAPVGGPRSSRVRENPERAPL